MGKANNLRDRNSSSWQHTLDQDHAVIYQRAVARLALIYALHPQQGAQAPGPPDKAAQEASGRAVQTSMASAAPSMGTTPQRVPLQCLCSPGSDGDGP